MVLAEIWHVDKPSTPPVVPNIKSKSYLNLLRACHMEPHQVKEWSHLVSPGEYPSVLVRSGAQ